MLKNVVDFGKQLFALTRDVQQNRADIKDLREEVKALRQELTALARVVERFAIEQQHDRENAEREREIQRLRLENILLRYERGLPPGSLKDETQE
jgi:hypothetical protein